jgi:hypothetical protein
MNTKLTLCVGLAFGVVGCSTLKPETVVAPSEVTVVEALGTVGEGLARLRDELDKGKLTTGLLVDEVQLTLNLTSKANDSKTLAVDISKTLASGTAGIGGKLFGLTSVETAEVSRGSVLLIKLKNAALVDIKNPKEREKQSVFFQNE